MVAIEGEGVEGVGCMVAIEGEGLKGVDVW